MILPEAQLSKFVMGELGLPNMAVNPLVARSFESNLKIKQQKFTK